MRKLDKNTLVSLVEQQKVDYAFFDVCGTLYNANTTYDFYRYLFKKYPRKSLAYYAFTSIPAKLIWKLLSLFNNTSLSRKIGLGLVKGFSENELKSNALEFFNERLIKLEINGIHDFMKYLHTRGVKIILVSASIHPVIEVIANHISAYKQFCTYLECDQKGCLTGNYIDLQGHKLEQIKKNFPDINLNNCVFVTDNIEDEPFLKAVGYPIVVAHESMKKHWLQKNIKTIYIKDK